jgi:hypothetical protein
MSAHRAPRLVALRIITAIVCLTFGMGSSFSGTYNFIPATFSLVNLNGGTVCVSGAAPKPIPYYLSPAGPAGTLGWSSTPNQNYYQVGSLAGQYSMVQTSPGGAYASPIASARLMLYVFPGAASCSSIPPSTIPFALFEYTTASVPNIPNPGDTAWTVVPDVSNVDNFQALSMFEIFDTKNNDNIIAQLGNSVYSSHVAITTAVNNPNVSAPPGVQWPFKTWLGNAPGSVATTFGVLAVPADGAAAMVEASKDYVAACNNSASCLSFSTTNINYYFDTEASTFFATAFNPGGSWRALEVVGDGVPPISQQVWSVDSQTKDCPVYVNGDGHSLEFSAPGYTFILCNPVGSVVPFAGTVSCYSCPITSTGPTQTFQLNVTPSNGFNLSIHNNWYFGQPAGLTVSTNPSIAAISSTAMITNAACGGGAGYCISFMVNCPLSSSTYTCPQPSTTAPGSTWAFSNIQPLANPQAGAIKIWETASEMIFANDGAFINWFEFYPGAYTPGPPPVLMPQYVVAQSVGRNIVQAFTRGIALCNNTLMNLPSPFTPPSQCKNVVPVNLQPPLPPGCNVTTPFPLDCPSNAYWANENNWYPQGGTEDYYSAFLHLAQLNGNSIAAYQPCNNYVPGQPSTGLNVCSNMFLPPNLYVSNSPCSTGYAGFARNPNGVLMAMVYGSGLDENPTYLPANSFANVPSKLDPIPTCWFDQTMAGMGTASLGLNVVIGRTVPLAAHNFYGSPVTTGGPFFPTSSIPWRDNLGDVAIWLMNGASVVTPGSVGNVPTNFSIVGQRDCNGDGYADLLWRDTLGNVAIWLMNGPQVLASVFVGNVPINWSVIGTGDFNGDGRGDILWRDNSDNVAIWLMSCSLNTATVPPTATATILQNSSLGNVPLSVAAVANGDFNGDGRADILWRDASGNTSIWFMNGTQVWSSAPVIGLPATSSVVGTGDFNGDGMSDIVLRDGLGNTAISLMNGASILSQGGLGNVPVTSLIALVGDYNGDGMSDLLWRDDLGNTSIWFMNGTTVVSSASVGNIPPAWTVQSVNAE